MCVICFQVDLKLPRHMLKTDSSTRWNSTYAMMVRLLEQEDAVRRVLADDSKTSHLLSGWWQDSMVLKDVTGALRDFAELTDALSGETHVTISAVIPLLDYIKKKAEGDCSQGEICFIYLVTYMFNE